MVPAQSPVDAQKSIEPFWYTCIASTPRSTTLCTPLVLIADTLSHPIMASAGISRKERIMSLVGGPIVLGMRVLVCVQQCGKFRSHVSLFRLHWLF